MQEKKIIHEQDFNQRKGQKIISFHHNYADKLSIYEKDSKCNGKSQEQLYPVCEIINFKIRNIL